MPQTDLAPVSIGGRLCTELVRQGLLVRAYFEVATRRSRSSITVGRVGSARVAATSVDGLPPWSGRGHARFGGLTPA